MTAAKVIKVCRKCRGPFEARPHQIIKRDYICRDCRAIQDLERRRKKIPKGRSRSERAEVKSRFPNEYGVWVGLRERCNNEKHPAFARYGGRGVTVCERWNSFEFFRQDMGARPSMDHSIDRINGDGNYEPSNCRWATRLEQGRNRIGVYWLEINGVRRALAEWCEIYGRHPNTVKRRHFVSGLSWESALSTPIRNKREIT